MFKNKYLILHWANLSGYNNVKTNDTNAENL